MKRFENLVWLTTDCTICFTFTTIFSYPFLSDFVWFIKLPYESTTFWLPAVTLTLATVMKEFDSFTILFIIIVKFA